MAIRGIPITVISGNSGAGKTAVCEHVRSMARSRRLAVLKDDGEGDLFDAIREAVELQGADCILIECAANLEPFFMAEYLVHGDESTPPPPGIRLDTLVTVIDASRFLTDVFESVELAEIGLSFDEEDERSLSEVLLEQVEFADVIIVNKADLLETDKLEALEALISRLNPKAHKVTTVRGKVDPEDLIGTGAFDFEYTEEAAGWLHELEGEFAELEIEHGVSSFTYTDRRPFHPIRFNELLNDFDVKGLVRAKGSVWVASRHHEIGVWSLAGKASLLSYGGIWFAATPARDWPKDERERAEIMNEWVPPFGDRRQEIAFIGIDMNEAEIRDRLDECLLTHDEMKNGPDSWFNIPDPLPDWHTDADLEI
jgi:G3E family GTPase